MYCFFCLMNASATFTCNATDKSANIRHTMELNLSRGNNMMNRELKVVDVVVSRSDSS